MDDLWFAAGVMFAVQLVSGCTLGGDQFRSFDTQSIPIGRWPRLVRRADEPTFFWVLIGCQFVLIFVFLMSRPKHKPQFDVQEMMREYSEEQHQKSANTGK